MQHLEAALRARDLACVRGERRLFDNLGFELRNGELLQVRGSNGSGKTSLLRMVCGLSAPAAGHIAWNETVIAALGEDFTAQLAYVGHLNAIKEELDPIENLALSAKLAGLEHDPASIEAAMRYFGLERSARLPCKVLSQGQKRRVALSRLHLSARRALWVLDEPFAALDPVGIAAMRSLLESHLARGGLALLTTHQDVPIAASAVQQLDLAA